MNKEITPFDSFDIIFTEHPNREENCFAIIAKHKIIPEFSFYTFKVSKKVMDAKEYGEMYINIFNQIYLCSLYGKYAEITIEDPFRSVIRKLITGQWDDSKKEWFILDENKQVVYEPEIK